MEERSHISEIFGSLVFDDELMKARLPAETYEALQRTRQQGDELTIDVANVVAEAMKNWALEKGATHFSHWFQPMTGATAEKHDAFLSTAPDGRVIMAFSGKMLIKGEADGSSFPSGGLRATFEARGYTTWDCTSPAFIKRDPGGMCVLCIPTAFCAFSGEALDEKTPLLRSMEALNKAALRVLRHLGLTDVKKVTTSVGAEQEYFLIDKSIFRKRKDLMYTGRTLFGAQPAKGQELGDQYYAIISERVSAFMAELNDELWRLGVTSKTQHNEAAPMQFELAPVFNTANIATDHNQIIMELLRKVADRHDFTCLLHEKPYEWVNGSGKHNNWSLMTDTGRNLLKPGKDVESNLPFMVFFIAMLAAVDEYASALRMCCAVPGNQQRLGGHEAPPAIISAYVGQRLSEWLEHVEHGFTGKRKEVVKMNMGVSTLAVLHKDETDRNRTSPFAFTADKFEFRMVGSSQSIAWPNTVLNTIMAEQLTRIAGELDASPDPQASVKEILARLVREHKRIVFNGNNYSSDWVLKAKKLGLSHIDNLVDAIEVLKSPKIVALFERHSVLSRNELEARRLISLRSFELHTRIEAVTMLKMSNQKIMPACIRFAGMLGESLNNVRSAHANAPTGAMEARLEELCARIERFNHAIDALETGVYGANQEDMHDLCIHMRDKVLPAMDELRAASDQLERLVDKELWPLPSYGEMFLDDHAL